MVIKMGDSSPELCDSLAWDDQMRAVCRCQYNLQYLHIQSVRNSEKKKNLKRD